MANQYDTNLKLQAIADAIGDAQSSGLIQALEDIADAVAGGGGGGSSTAGLVSDNFSETDTYDLGDYCIHNNTLYVCINAISTPGPWDLSDWQATNAGMELSSLNSALATTDYTSDITNINTKLASSGYIKAYKTGNMVTLLVYKTINTALSGMGEVICNLPSELRPPEDWRIFGNFAYNNTAGLYGAQVLTNGNVITATGGGSITGTLFISVSFMSAS